MTRGVLKVLCLCWLLQSGALCAGPDVQVLGLFNGKAVLKIAGKQRTMSAGETSPEGIRLIAADSEAALLEIDGVQGRYPLGSHIETGFQRPDMPEVNVYADTNGMFMTVGNINGLPVTFLVDTGATDIAMNSHEAARLGIDYRVIGRVGQVVTASGVVPAWSVNLDTVGIGDIKIRNVAGIVMEGALPAQVLLGMTFLERVEMRRDGHVLHMRRKY
jgi:aspartyl protease family protein